MHGDIPEITQGAQLGGLLSAGGLEAQAMDFNQDLVPEAGLDVLVQPVGGLEILARVHIPKGSMLLFVEPRVAAHLRAHVRSTQRKAG